MQATSVNPSRRLELCGHRDLKPWQRPGYTPFRTTEGEYENNGVVWQEWRCAECGDVVAVSSRRATEPVDA